MRIENHVHTHGLLVLHSPLSHPDDVAGELVKAFQEAGDPFWQFMSSSPWLVSTQEWAVVQGVYAGLRLMGLMPEQSSLSPCGMILHEPRGRQRDRLWKYLAEELEWKNWREGDGLSFVASSAQMSPPWPCLSEEAQMFAWWNETGRAQHDRAVFWSITK